MAGKATGKAQARSRPQAQGKERQGKQNPESGRGSGGSKGGTANGATARKGGEQRNEQRGKGRPEPRGRERAEPRQEEELQDQSQQGQDEGQEQSEQSGQGAGGASKVTDTAKQHPITTAAIGAGLTLLAAQGLRMAISSMSGNGAAGGASAREEDQEGEESDSPEGSYSDEGEEGEDDEAEADDDSPEASASGEDEGDEAQGEEDDDEGGESGFTGRLRGVGSAMRTSRDAIKRGAQSGFERGRQAADENWQTHPLMLCGLALAVGAAVGFMLPSTRQEDQMMGESSDKVTGRLKKTGQKFFRQGRQIAGKVVSEAVSTTQREAEKEGLTPDRLGKKVKRVFGSVRNAVSDAVQDE